MNLPISTHDFVKLQHENIEDYFAVKMYFKIIEHVKFLEQDLNPGMFLGKNPIFEGWKKTHENSDCIRLECENYDVPELWYFKKTKHFEGTHSEKKLTKIKDLC